MYTSFKFEQKKFEEIPVLACEILSILPPTYLLPFMRYMHSENALLKFQICTIVNKSKRFYNHDEQKENYINLI